MEKENGEVHVEADEVRGGSTPNIVRYVLIISLVLAVGLLSIIWITGALSQGDVEDEVTMQQNIEDMDSGDSTDSIIMDDQDMDGAANRADELQSEAEE